MRIGSAAGGMIWDGGRVLHQLIGHSPGAGMDHSCRLRMQKCQWQSSARLLHQASEVALHGEQHAVKCQECGCGTLQLPCQYRDACLTNTVITTTSSSMVFTCCCLHVYAQAVLNNICDTLADNAAHGQHTTWRMAQHILQTIANPTLSVCKGEPARGCSCKILFSVATLSLPVLLTWTSLAVPEVAATLVILGSADPSTACSLAADDTCA